MAIQGRREGVFFEITPEGKTVNVYESFTCGHCQHLSPVFPGQSLDDLGNFCLKCARPTCKACSYRMANGGMCDPFEKKLERTEARDILRRSMEASQ